MTIQEWLASETVIEKSRRSYAHFDCCTDIAQKRSYISVPRNIERHGFYPFIHYEQKQTKFSKTGRKKRHEIFAMRRILIAAFTSTTASYLEKNIIGVLFKMEYQK